MGFVVVADGDKQARELAVSHLKRAGYETIQVDTGVGALEAGVDEGVGLVLLEVSLPDMTGYEVCRELRLERGDDLPIFFLSGTRTEALDRVAGLLIGADDFIVKPFDGDELVARVRRFIRRPVETAPKENDTNGRALHLTEREREILDLLVAGERPKGIASRLSISQKTVSTHIQNLLGKFKVHSRAELVAHAYLMGHADSRRTSRQPETSVQSDRRAGSASRVAPAEQLATR
jgi:DNA-binding response OmpR family regulator